MPIVADAAVAVRGDFSKFPTDLKKAEGPITSLGDKLKNALSPKAALAGLGAGLAGAFAVSKVGEFIGDAISAASDLNESLSKSQVVFGDSAAAIEEWADDSAQAFGQSKQAALEAVGTYGNLFQAFGVGQQEAADMSQKLVELAADLASFNNTSVDDALLALRSGLSGETEPLKRYGIAISDARLRTELMRQGVKNLGATLTPLQKSTASYALIMQDSALAQGDFARTSGGLANQQRILDAQLTDLTATIGERLLPVVTAVVTGLNDLTEAAGDLGPVLDGISWTVARLGDGLRVIAAPILLAADTIHEVTTEKLGSIPADTAAKLREGGPLIEEAIRDTETGIRDSSAFAISVPISDAAKEANRKAVEIARGIPGNISDAIIQGQKDLEDGLAALKELMDTSLSDLEKIAYANAVLVDPAVQAALLDERADVRDAAQKLVDDANETLGLLESGAYDAAVDAGISLDEQLRLNEEKVTRATVAMMRGSRSYLETLDWSVNGPTLQPPRVGGRSQTESGMGAGGSTSTFTPRSQLPLANLQTGALSIPQTGPYNLHASEMVVPPGAAAALRDFFGSGGLGMPASVTNIWNLSVNGVPYRFETRDDFMKGLDTLSSFTGDGRLPDNG